MSRILTWLASHDDARICLHYHGSTLYYVSLHGMRGERPKRVTRTTFRAMEKRGWLEYVTRRDNGGTMGKLPNGRQGIVVHSFNLYYQLSAKGLQAARIREKSA